MVELMNYALLGGGIGRSALLVLGLTTRGTMAKNVTLLLALLSMCAVYCVAYTLQGGQSSGAFSNVSAKERHVSLDRTKRQDDEFQSEFHANHSSQDSPDGIHVASWRWNELGIYFTFTTFIIIAGLAKVGKSSSLHYITYYALLTIYLRLVQKTSKSF